MTEPVRQTTHTLGEKVSAITLMVLILIGGIALFGYGVTGMLWWHGWIGR